MMNLNNRPLARTRALSRSRLALLRDCFVPRNDGHVRHAITVSGIVIASTCKKIKQGKMTQGSLKGRTCMEEFCLSGSFGGMYYRRLRYRLPAVMKITSLRDLLRRVSNC
jgi:hypothetical protein